MDFRRGGNRRRRAILDDLYQVGPLPLRSTRRNRRDRNYSDRALLENQPRITDVIPKWDSTLGFWFLVGLGTVAGAIALNLYAEIWSRAMGEVSLTYLRFDSAWSLPAWLSTVWMLVAAVYAALIYHVRRYKVDDYRGSYTIWLWAAGLWAIASLDASGTLFPLWKGLLVQATGAALGGDGTLWPWAIVGGVFALSAGRLAIDVWRCRSALMLLGAATACFFVAAAVALGALTSVADEALAKTIGGGAQLAGYFLLAFVHIVYARYVYLDAQGLISSRGKDGEELDDEEDMDDEELQEALDIVSRSQGVSPGAVHPTEVARIAASLGARIDPAHLDDTPDVSQLSKTEKKRLKRLMRGRNT